MRTYTLRLPSDTELHNLSVWSCKQSKKRSEYALSQLELTIELSQDPKLFDGPIVEQYFLSPGQSETVRLKQRESVVLEDEIGGNLELQLSTTLAAELGAALVGKADVKAPVVNLGGSFTLTGKLAKSLQKSWKRSLSAKTAVTTQSETESERISEIKGATGYRTQVTHHMLARLIHLRLVVSRLNLLWIKTSYKPFALGLGNRIEHLDARSFKIGETIATARLYIPAGRDRVSTRRQDTKTKAWESEPYTPQVRSLPLLEVAENKKRGWKLERGNVRGELRAAVAAAALEAKERAHKKKK